MLETSLLCRQIFQLSFDTVSCFIHLQCYLCAIHIQEFMILPTGAASFKEAMKMGVEVYHNLKAILIFFMLSFGCLVCKLSVISKLYIFCYFCSLLSRRSMGRMPPMLVMRVVLLRTFRLAHDLNVQDHPFPSSCLGDMKASEHFCISLGSSWETSINVVVDLIFSLFLDF